MDSRCTPPRNGEYGLLRALTFIQLFQIFFHVSSLFWGYQGYEFFIYRHQHKVLVLINYVCHYPQVLVLQLQGW